MASGVSEVIVTECEVLGVEEKIIGDPKDVSKTGAVTFSDTFHIDRTRDSRGFT